MTTSSAEKYMVNSLRAEKYPICFSARKFENGFWRGKSWKRLCARENGNQFQACGKTWKMALVRGNMKTASACYKGVKTRNWLKSCQTWNCPEARENEHMICRSAHSRGNVEQTWSRGTSLFVCTHSTCVLGTVLKLVHSKRILVHLYVVAGTIFKNSANDATLKIEGILSWNRLEFKPANVK